MTNPGAKGGYTVNAVRRGCLAAIALLAALLAAGCTVVADGTPHPAAGLAPRPVIGDQVKQVLPDAAQLAEVLGQSFALHPTFAPKWGIDNMPSGLASETDAAPHDCVGVVDMAQKSMYYGSDMQDFAMNVWAKADSHRVVKVLEVWVSVVALRTAADADRLFAKFSGQWQRCEGTVVTKPPKNNLAERRAKIVDVQVTDSLLTAGVRLLSDGGPGLRAARALGVRANCVVEAALYFDTRGGSGSGNPDTSAADIAHAMMDKVSALS